jgi:hypothetical protein
MRGAQGVQTSVGRMNMHRGGVLNPNDWKHVSVSCQNVRMSAGWHKMAQMITRVSKSLKNVRITIQGARRLINNL